MDKIIEEVGEENIIQVVTDNEQSWQSGGPGRAGPKLVRAKIDPDFSGQNFSSPSRPKNRAGRAK